MPFREYRRGFTEALEGHRPDPPIDAQRVIGGSCDERAHYLRGHADGRKAKAGPNRGGCSVSNLYTRPRKAPKQCGLCAPAPAV